MGKIIFLTAGLLAVLVVWGKLTANPGPKAPQTKISGLVIPHHETANDLVIRAVEKIKINQSPRYIVVFCPNHFRPQSPTFTSSESQTGYPVSRNIVSRLIEEYPQLVTDDQLVADEHGTGNPIKILKAAFPGAEYIPLLVSPYFVPEGLQKMADILTSIMPPDTLYVASVDFSHNQMTETAIRYDAQTLEAMKNFNYRTLYGFSDNNLDSPAAMATFLMIMKNINTTAWETWEESHGALLSGNPALPGTSYVTGVFR